MGTHATKESANPLPASKNAQLGKSARAVRVSPIHVLALSARRDNSAWVVLRVVPNVPPTGLRHQKCLFKRTTRAAQVQRIRFYRAQKMMHPVLVMLTTVGHPSPVVDPKMSPPALMEIRRRWAARVTRLKVMPVSGGSFSFSLLFSDDALERVAANCNR